MNSHDVTKAFEADLCKYTGAPYAVAVNSCTMALLLCCGLYRQLHWHTPKISIPKRTYVGVAMSILHSRCELAFHDEDWSGEYALKNAPAGMVMITDSARRFTGGMFATGPLSVFQCVSFHVSKILGHSQGGAILHNDPEADAWLRRARFDGRTEGVHPKSDTFDMLGYHCYMSPDVAAALRWKLACLPRINPDLPNSDYSDLSTAPIFQR